MTSTGERFAAGDDNVVVAKTLRVHVRSVQRWQALASPRSRRGQRSVWR